VPIVLSDIELWVKLRKYSILTRVVKKEASLILRKYFSIKYYYTFERKPSGTCVFLENNKCTIYSVRPLTCRLFPFAYSEEDLELHPWALRNCRGIGKGGPFNRREVKILKLLAKKIFIELITLPFYSTFIEEIIVKAKEK